MRQLLRDGQGGELASVEKKHLVQMCRLKASQSQNERPLNWDLKENRRDPWEKEEGRMRSVQVRGMWLGFAYEWRVVGDGAGELWR